MAILSSRVIVASTSAARTEAGAREPTHGQAALLVLPAAAAAGPLAAAAPMSANVEQARTVAAATAVTPRVPRLRRRLRQVRDVSTLTGPSSAR